jgi:diguanylate cyclase (GGDEF)-like protein/PAS domain S-box-containing protein
MLHRSGLRRFDSADSSSAGSVPMDGSMRGRLWILYVVGALATLGGYYASAQTVLIFHLVGVSAAVGILLGVFLYRPTYRLPWVLFAVGQLFFVTGDVLSYNYDKFFGTELPYPAISDAFYLAVYPCLVAGVLLIVRRRTAGRDRGGLIDAAMVAIGIGVVSWVFLIAPYVHDTEMLWLEKATAMSYPFMDLLLMAVTARLIAGGGRKPVSFYLLGAGVAALFVTDAIYGWFLLNQGYTPGEGPLEAGWALFYILLGAAALHPSMSTVSDRQPETDAHVSLWRLSFMGAACLLAPATQALAELRGQAADLQVVLGATIVLFLLAMIRMGGLVRQQAQSALRERALREAGSALVTATSREQIFESTLRAARTAAGERSVLRVLSVEGNLLEVVAAEGGSDVLGATFSLLDFDAWKRSRLMAGDSYHVPATQAHHSFELGLLEAEANVLVTPMLVRNELRAVIVAAVPGELSPAMTRTVEALASQASLALESALLTEELFVKQSEARFASLVRNASDVVTVVEIDSTITYASPSSLRTLGYPSQDLEGMRYVDLVHEEDTTRVITFLAAGSDNEDLVGTLEFRIRRSDGGYIYAEALRTNLINDPNVRGIVLTTRDVSERREFEEQLSHQAFHDSLTGLANRVLFRDRVTHALERQERDQRPVSVLFMDLDDFKTINDSLGHAAGDVLLAEVGERIRAILRAPDTAARLGGDEFAVLLEDSGDGIGAADVAERLIQSLEAPFHLENKEVFVRASIGIAVAEPGTHEIDDVEALMRNADVAMYMAKERGKNRYQMFEPEMHETALKRLELKADLQRALEHQEFVLMYQPVIELDTGRISGMEALIRWIHPERGLVPPLDFIPLAEETGLIVPIGRWVLRQACAYAAGLHDRFPTQPPLHMAVNLSAKQLARADVIDDVRGILSETGLDPSALILEITESVMMADMELSIARLTELKSLGVQIAIDDFGTGYSSLNYVRRFPVDILKVDKSFIDGVSEEGESSALTAAVIELAGILNLKPVAEGIERVDQLERLLELHCALGQGFYFAKPLETGNLEAMLGERIAMEAEAGLRPNA